MKAIEKTVYDRERNGEKKRDTCVCNREKKTSVYVMERKKTRVCDGEKKRRVF